MPPKKKAGGAKKGKKGNRPKRTRSGGSKNKLDETLSSETNEELSPDLSPSPPPRRPRPPPREITVVSSIRL